MKWNELDQLIRAGKSKEVQEYLQKIPIRSIDRKDRFAIAKIATRVGAVEMALKILSPVVRDRDKYAEPPSSAERSEYARALSRVGGVQEAFKVLHEAKALEYPDALLIRAGLHMGYWDYEASIPYLEKYLLFHDITEYDRLVARSNLYSCLVYEDRLDDAERVYEELTQETDLVQERRLVTGFVQQVRARYFLKSGQFDKASEMISASQESLSEANDRNAIFSEKWKSVIDLHTKGPNMDVLTQLQSVRDRAWRSGMYETVRELDLFETKFTRHENKFNHLYFGTPFPKYKERIMKEVGPGIETRDSYVWRVGHLKESQVLKLTSGRLTSGEAVLKGGSESHNLIKCLSADFYAPATIGTIYAYLFKDEYYDPKSAKQRVQTAISRTNKLFAERGLDLKIAFDRNSYFLKTDSAFAIQREVYVDKRSREGVQLRELLSKLGQKSFSSDEAAKIIDMPKRSMIRVLNFGLENGILEKRNAGRATEYRFRKSN
ncbi:MAG: hypothetical protein KDD25_05655 [Bdellovibrionales bacterium]|nr:hypothetical protein [Bdellovibrionales bacterium]